MYTLESLNRLVAKNGIMKVIPYLLSNDVPQCLRKQLEQEPNGLLGYLKKHLEREGVFYGDFLPDLIEYLKKQLEKEGITMEIFVPV